MDPHEELPMGANVARGLGLSPLDEQKGPEAFNTLTALLGKLSKQQPQLGIGDEVRTALASKNPAAEFHKLFEKYREQLVEVETTV